MHYFYFAITGIITGFLMSLFGIGGGGFVGIWTLLGKTSSSNLTVITTPINTTKIIFIGAIAGSSSAFFWPRRRHPSYSTAINLGFATNAHVHQYFTTFCC